MKIDAEEHKIDILEGAQSILCKTLILMVEQAMISYIKC